MLGKIGFFLIIVVILEFNLFAQDMREVSNFFFYSELLNKSTINSEIFSWKISSKTYLYDLNGDQENEAIKILRLDGSDFFCIFDDKEQIVLQKKLKKTGINSCLYKMKLVKIAPEVKTLIIYYFQGQNNYTNYHGQSTFFFLTFFENNLEKHIFQKGPVFWSENMINLSRYYNKRIYEIELEDINLDGIKEIVFKFEKIEKIFYFNNGQWVLFN